ncbi:MAG: FAD-binding domain-containing protein [Hyphomicrobiales bacterium]|nr:FAD-binding domain-containing protein [Hyphomicrobiales bacterium]
MTFHPSREAALARLQTFIPDAGRHYAARRNYDYGPSNRSNISQLSPYVRHRILTEQEVVQAVLEVHSLSAAEKFIQEVCWRTYWKGWLERRPQVWTDYLRQLEVARGELEKNSALRRRYDKAVAGATGIDAFDAFSRELAGTGYLHNHARMWSASIWIYTLNLPWELGADHFFRHLIDGDPASNTLSWRWVGGMQTVGKTYLARPDNIEKYTGGRFKPEGLSARAEPLIFDNHPPALPVPPIQPLPSGSTALFLTEDDLNPESLAFGGMEPVTVIALDPAALYRGYSPHVIGFKQAAMADALARATAHFGCDGVLLPADAADEIISWIKARNLPCAASAYSPIGYSQSAMHDLQSKLGGAGIAFGMVRRAWDEAFWPHASRGFFQLKEKIEPVLNKLLRQPSLF